ncbi:hypothetical protein MTP99_014271 [Tenebrio molitor]|jgi:hypothetical protein|nr:hypothetical protein MTP99_014271 [Tenebrio molitor]
MEKESQPDSMTTVTIKPDYPPSEVYSSEPPPAYHRSQSSAVQVAKIIAVTVVLVSIVLGSFLLASAYVTANASCRQLQQELELFNEAADKFQSPLAPEPLIQEEPQSQKRNIGTVQKEEREKNINEIDNNSVDSSENSEDSGNRADSDDESSSSESVEKIPIRIKLPLQLNFDDLAGALIEKNQKSRMNCVVEKKRAEEIVDHQPKTLRLPFGVNLTTDPRYERVSGERMAIFCESGNMENQTPSENEEDEEDATIMIQPVMIPIPPQQFPTHMAQQLRPTSQQHQPHPMETMRPPMPLQMQHEDQNQLPPNQILHQIAQEIISQKIMEAQRAREEQNENVRSNSEPNHRFSVPEQAMAQRIPIPEEVLSQLNRLPNRDVIVTVSQQEFEDAPHEPRDIQMHPQEMRGVQQEIRVIPQEMASIPQEINTVVREMHSRPQEVRPVPQKMEINSEQGEMRVGSQVAAEAPQEMHVVHQQRENAQEINGRQAYARVLPIHIPVHMIQQGQIESRNTPSEEARPHYVQPRSVRSVDALLPKSEKRVKRCSCDCAC